MRVEVLETPDAVAARAGADVVAFVARHRAGCHLVLATGRTMQPLYGWLAANFPRDLLPGVRFFNLDEYAGLRLRRDLDGAHDLSFARFLHERLLDPLGVGPALVRLMDGRAAEGDFDRYAADYVGNLFAPGWPVAALLGIGRDGHLAFHMPGTPLARGMHLAALSERTMEDNWRAAFAPAGVPRDRMPRAALTLGVADIARADKALALATGAGKSEAVRELFSTSVGDHFPATALRNHPDATLYVDRAAGSGLPMAK